MVGQVKNHVRLQEKLIEYFGEKSRRKEMKT
jgi:hypothetical protein